uniref:Uncharacterized protein n=1 Tax=Anguilla anguilla TaxID=7936 RepID=A0A0E9WQ93_ANGAN
MGLMCSVHCSFCRESILHFQLNLPHLLMIPSVLNWYVTN